VVGVCDLQVRLRLGGGLPSVSLGGAGRVYMLDHLGFEQLGPQPGFHRLSVLPPFSSHSGGGLWPSGSTSPWWWVTFGFPWWRWTSVPVGAPLLLTVGAPNLCFINWLCRHPFRRIVVGVCGLQVRLRIGGGLPSVSLCGAGRVYLLEHLGFENSGGHLCFIDCLCCRPFRRIVVGVCGIQVRLRLGGGLPSVSLGGAGRVYLFEHLGFEQLGPPTCVSSIGCVATLFVA